MSKPYALIILLLSSIVKSNLEQNQKRNQIFKDQFATPLGDILLYTKEKYKIISRYYQRTYDLLDTWFSGILPP